MPGEEKEKKSFFDILRSDVSMRSIKDLLFWEIPTPFKEPDKPDLDKLFNELDQVDVDKPLRDLLSRIESEGQPVGHLLVDAGIISERDLERVTEEQKRTGNSFPQILVNLRIVPASRIHETVRTFQRYIEQKMSGNTLEDIILAEGLLDRARMTEAIKASHKDGLSLEQAILKMKIVSLEKLGELFEKRFHIKPIDLAKTKIAKSAVTILPNDIMREGQLIPFRKRGKELHVAMADPRNQGLLDRLRIMSGMDIKPFLASQDDIEKALDEFVEPAPAPEASPANTESVFGSITSTSTAPPEKIEQVESESTVRLVNRIIEGGFNARATDIHLEPQENRLRVRYRIDGILYDVMSIAAESAGPTISRLKVLAGMDITERRRPQDGHINIESGPSAFTMRASTLPTKYGEKMVMRLLNEGAVLRGLQQLGFEDDDLARFKQYIEHPYGMILVTGPIGSGKTTTLYSALNEVNRSTVNVITIEDPIEYQLPGINQVQVDAKVDMDFATGLRAILRQDANVLMVGEIRDPETARTAVRAAMTGHLLFSTLHTNTAVSAITTLRHLGVLSFLIASSLVCVVAQRLVRKVCPHCCTKYIPPLSVREELGMGSQSRRPVNKAVGCDQCYHTGYIGRTGIYEILGMSPAIREMIVDEKPESEILAQARSEGMTSLTDACRKKILSGETTLEEFMRTIYT